MKLELKKIFPGYWAFQNVVGVTRGHFMNELT